VRPYPIAISSIPIECISKTIEVVMDIADISTLIVLGAILDTAIAWGICRSGRHNRFSASNRGSGEEESENGEDFAEHWVLLSWCRLDRAY
jgi:hypothetical protein